MDENFTLFFGLIEQFLENQGLQMALAFQTCWQTGWPGVSFYDRGLPGL
jgi:hypothetical protein